MPLFSKNRSEAHWSKDYIEHLRSIHFFLIAAAVTGIIFGLTPTKAQRQRAQYQLRTILAFINAQQQLSKQEDKDLANPMEAGDFLTFKMQGKDYFLEKPAVITLAADCALDLRTPKSHYVVPTGTWRKDFENIESLTEFISKWDATHCERGGILKVTKVVGSAFDAFGSELPLSTFSGKSATLLQRHYKFVRTELRRRDVEAGDDRDLITSLSRVKRPLIETIVATPSDGGSEVLERFYQLDTSDLDMTLVVRGLYAPTDSNPFVFMEPEYYRLGITAAPTVIKSPRLDCLGSFKKCFHDLYQLTLDKTSWSLKDVSETMDSELANSERQFELGGIKFPSEDLSTGGIILIIAVLAYFCLHLRELSPRFDSGLEVAWLGLYSSWFAYVLVWLSILLVPSYAVALLGMKGSQYEGPFPRAVKSNWKSLLVWIAVPCVATAVLGVLSCLSARRLAHLAADPFSEDESTPGTTTIPVSTPETKTIPESTLPGANDKHSADGLGDE